MVAPPGTKSGIGTGSGGYSKGGASAGIQYGEGPLSSALSSNSAYDRKQKQRKADADAEAAKAAAGHSGSGAGRQGAVPAGRLPPGMNPLKYSPTTTQSFDPTLNNAIGVGTAIASMAVPGVGPAIAIGKSLLDDEFDPLNPFDSPTGPVGGAGTYDGSEVSPAETGLGEDTAPKKKKKKAAAVAGAAPGLTLLQGAGGTLLGS